MEKELNIAAILKDKPKGTKLWSPIVGNCTFSGISSKNGAIVASFVDKDGEQLDWDFNEYGKTLSAPKEAEVCLFPSDGMRDWEKFAWKKGDVLTTKTKSLSVVFDHFNATYESFVAKYSFCSYQEKNEDDAWNKEGENSYKTLCFSKVSGNEAKEFIKKVEEHYGGKLNLETLEIEQPKQEFKDGDIVFNKDGICSVIGILKEHKFFPKSEGFVLYNVLYPYSGVLSLNRTSYKTSMPKFRLATDLEKQQLFEALAKEDKAWIPETKQIVDLPKKCEFKTMDWCLMRDHREKWKLCQFGFFDKGYGYEAAYNAVGGNWYNECIPYNDQTAHLLGTTDEWEGGK